MRTVDAMEYEYLIRRSYQCGRFGNAAANADVYRGLERSYGHFKSESEAAQQGKPKTWNKPLDELERDYKKQLATVSSYVDNAIGEALIRFRSTLNDEQLTALTALRDRLNQPTFEELDDVIGQAQEIMVEAQIFPK